MNRKVQTSVKRYRSIKAYEKDASTMGKIGWDVQTVTSQPQKKGCCGCLLLGPVLQWARKGPKDVIIVTYAKRV